MTPELAAERASDMLDLAADSIIHGDIVENRIALADAWMRLHNALATTQARDFLAVKTEPSKPALTLPMNFQQPPIIRRSGIDYRIIGAEFDPDSDEAPHAFIRFRLARV